MPKKLELVGQRFGRLIVLKEDGKDRHGASLWWCKCDCGNETLARGSQIKSGVTESCGCGIAISASKPRTHGSTHTPLYMRWRAMLNRCLSQNSKVYKNYGGRGITVCDRWLASFENFRDDMGDTFHPNLELDRHHTDGNYEPLNCRWITQAAQQRNKRTNHLLQISGTTKLLIEWSEETGIKANTILTRVRRGWPESRLLELANK